MSKFLPQDVIMAKRDGQTLSVDQIEAFVAGITDGSVVDAQIAALAMSVFLNGMTAEEGAGLTFAMRDSGDVIDWTAYGLEPGSPVVDKHSTGGVGDKVSLMLAPIVAACGGFVPMISGRGLGHTGGTLDKLESIPGYNAFPSIDRFAELVKTIGCSIIGQTSSLAPADKRFYAVRDVTGTVESIPLITASILSKKLAAGLSALVMDVKFGSGAFMATQKDAQRLADSIVRVGKAGGVPVSALLTDMNEVLGHSAGNAVEIFETCAFLTDPRSADKRLLDVTLALAADMLALSGAIPDQDQALSAARSALENGKAADVFDKMVAAQGGPVGLTQTVQSHVELAPVVRDIPAPAAGVVTAIDTRAIGQAVVALGGGRTDPAAAVDHGVGFDHIVGRGTAIEVGQPLARVFARSDAAAEAAAHTLTASLTIEESGSGAGNPIVAAHIRPDTL